MKELDNVFKNDKKKKSSILNKKIKVNKELTTPRKISNDDYETIRLFAFNNRITMLETTEYLYEAIKDDKIDTEKIDVDESEEYKKSLRISNNLNKYLRNVNNTTKIPIKYLFSHLVHEHLSDKVIRGVKNDSTNHKFI